MNTRWGKMSYEKKLNFVAICAALIFAVFIGVVIAIELSNSCTKIHKDVIEGLNIFTCPKTIEEAATSWLMLFVLSFRFVLYLYILILLFGLLAKKIISFFRRTSTPQEKD